MQPPGWLRKHRLERWNSSHWSEGAADSPRERRIDGKRVAWVAIAYADIAAAVNVHGAACAGCIERDGRCFTGAADIQRAAAGMIGNARGRVDPAVGVQRNIRPGRCRLPKGCL